MCEKGVFSVGIVCYRNFTYLKEAISSVLQQDYEKIEIIVSDDGSPDFPAEEIQSFIETEKHSNVWRVEVRREQKNVGTVRHLNHVRRCCHGTFITFLAGDDMLATSHVLSAYANGFKDASEDCFIEMAQTAMYDLHMQRLSEYYLKKPVQESIVATKDSGSALLRDLVLYGPCLPSTSTCFKSEFFDKFGDFDESYTVVEDYPLHIRLAQEGWTVHYENFVAIKHRHGGISHGRKSATTASSNAYFKDIYRAIENLRIPCSDILEPTERKVFLRKMKREAFWIERTLAKNSRQYGKWLRTVLLHPVMSTGCFFKICEAQCWRAGALSKKLLLAYFFMAIFKNSIADVFSILWHINVETILCALRWGVLGVLSMCTIVWGVMRLYSTFNRFPGECIAITHRQ